MSRPYGFFVVLRMIITLIWLLILLPVLSVITIILTFLSLGKLSSFLTKWVGFLMGRTGLAVAGVRLDVKYHGNIPGEPAIYLFNHSSTLDMFIIVALLLPNIRFIAKKELRYNPFFWVLSTMSGQIMIDRKDTRTTAEQLHQAYEYVKKKQLSLAFAPEGTRSLNGKISPFKSGAFHAALHTKYPVIPIFIEGAFKLCPGNSLITLPGTVTVHIHPPIDTSDWNRKNLREQTERIRNEYLRWNGESGR